MCGNKYKEGRDEGENYCSRENGGFLVTRGNHPKTPPGIFHVELKELAGIMEAKRTQKLYVRRKVGMQRTFKLPFMHTLCTHIECFDNTNKWGYHCHLL